MNKSHDPSIEPSLLEYRRSKLVSDAGARCPGSPVRVSSHESIRFGRVEAKDHPSIESTLDLSLDRRDHTNPAMVVNLDPTNKRLPSERRTKES